jgi:F0F1-type ATP synthase assembly protein I
VLAIDLPHARRLAYGVVLGQAGLTLIIALCAWGLAGRRAAASALAGGAIAWVTNRYAARLALVPERSLGAAMGRALLGELVRVISTITFFVAATRVPHVSWPALLCGYAAVLVASWWRSAGLGTPSGLPKPR